LIFSSFRFLLFFPIVLLLYFTCRRLRYRQYLLLVASYVFYASWNPIYLSLIVISTVIDYVAGMRIPTARTPAAKRGWLLVSVVVNLGILVYFKYANFFIESFQDLLGVFGVESDPFLLVYVLPVGISFYTFQSMSYSLDIYRGHLKPTKDFVTFAVFVAFFPQLVAGPIVRAVEFLPQIRQNMLSRWSDFSEGGHRFLVGLTKKLLIADNLAPYVDKVFRDVPAYDGLTIWMGALGFAVQVYCDFSGYTDMAIGSARILGFRLPENFKYPLMARNVADFWRRWHITLYSFMRDYLYIFLGGSRVSSARLAFNGIFTMTVVGLWHGANWPMITWGFFNGLLVVGYRFMMIPIKKSPTAVRFLDSILGVLLRVAVVNVLFVIGLAIFRAPTIGNSMLGVWHMLTLDSAGQSLFDGRVWLFYAVVLLFSFACEYDLPSKLIRRTPFALKCPAYAFVIVLLVLYGVHDTSPFVYFQF
jgi:alginate O-acetyltransferase complex protein AlgI